MNPFTDSHKKIWILYLEDQTPDVQLVQAMLSREGLMAEMVHVNDRSGFQDKLKEREFDLVLADFNLPGFNGLEALEILKKTRPDIPFVFFSGSFGEDFAIDSLKAGAADYVLKNRPNRLPAAIHRAIEHSREERLRRKTEEALRRSEERYRGLVEDLSDVVFITNEAGIIRYLSQSIRLLMGGDGAALVGGGFERIIHSEDLLNLKKYFEEIPLDGKSLHGDFRFISFKGEVRHFHLSSRSTTDERGNREIRGLLSDVTERRLSEIALVEAHHQLEAAWKRTSEIAFRDPITRLPNRFSILETLERELRVWKKESRTAALLLINIDSFRYVNFSTRFEIGDACLLEIGRRLQGIIPPEALLGRYVGGQFLCILPNFQDMAACEELSKKIQAATEANLSVEEHEFRLTASVGISIFPGDSDSGENLLRHAESALRQAKREGIRQIRRFTEKDRASLKRRLELERKMLRPEFLQELHFHYQPKRDLRTGQVTSIESLARWQSPEYGNVSPGEFIVLAEEIGVIAEIGLKAISEALRLIETSLPPRLEVAVNLSPIQMKRPDFLPSVKKLLEGREALAGRVEFEFTEGTLMDVNEGTSELISDLRQLGFRFAIDDFGTGYSNLHYLSRFPLDTLKIDQSFVRGIMKNTGEEKIIHAIIAMATAFNIQTVAEGIETAEQESFLRQCGCTIGQGYLFSKPLPEDKLTTYLQGASG